MAAEQTHSSESYRVAPDLLRPIPIEVPSVAGWKEVPLQAEDEYGLVPLGLFAPEFGDIATSSIYHGERDDSPYKISEVGGARPTIFVRRGVAERLVRAQALLPADMKLVVYDAYRPLVVQQALYDKYINELRAEHPDWSQEQLSAETQNFVSIPSAVPTRPSPHSTGGSVDFTIIKISPDAVRAFAQMQAELPDPQAGAKLWDALMAGKAKLSFPASYTRTLPESVQKWMTVQLERDRTLFRDSSSHVLNFGTQFDYGIPDGKADPNYFEILEQKRPLTPDEIEARDSRRIEYNLMAQVGMQPLDSEWWHYNAPESQMGAKAAGLDKATYGAAKISDENQRFQDARSEFDRSHRFLQTATHLAKAAIISPAA